MSGWMGIRCVFIDPVQILLSGGDGLLEKLA